MAGLFEVLPLYIILFLFLAFSVNYFLNFHSIDYRFPVISHHPQLKHQITGFALVVLLLISIYFTIYLPYQKNLLLINANNISGKSSEQIFDNYKKALEFRSPIGQNELEGNLFLFTFNLINYLQQQNSPLLRNKDFVDGIISFNEEWFHPDQYAGVKNLYIFNAMIMKTYEATGDKKYLKQAKELAAIGAQTAPSRIEFVDLQYNVAKAEKDEETMKILEAKLKKIRPDLELGKLF